ncbi:siderophore-interacting protein [Corynebacterium sp.]|uniref:siderophore-interacting protein n=1 Tax=Corynebacterium sp. TaxID=1720 RepID=UPI003B3B6829
MPRISRDTDIYPITMRELEVLRIEDVTPGMRRVVFGGEGLHAHVRDGEDVPAIVSDGFDDDMRMIFPHPATGERPYPVSLGDGRLDWTAEVNELFRTYTVRSWEPDAGEFGELVVDFARHGAGLAEGWSSTAAVGDRVYAAGPKNCASLPVHTDWLLLIGDETALPAIGRCLEETPAGHRVVAVVEVADRADIQPDLAEVACAGSLDLRWVVRAEGGDFTEVVSALGDQRDTLPAGTPFVWAGGEAGRLKTVRRFVKDLGVPREHVQITGYWRKNDAPAAVPADGGRDAGATGGAATGDSAGTSSISVLMQLHELTEIAPGLALQAAARLRLFETVDAAMDSAGGPSPVSAVAAAVGVDEPLLIRFLRYLESVDLLSIGADGADGAATVRLTTLGTELADPDGVVSRLTGPDALQSLTWLHLDQGLRTGRPVDAGPHGDWASVKEQNPALADAAADSEATRAQWVAPALARQLGALPGGAPSSIAVAGAAEGVAAAVYADELLRADDDLTVSVLTLADGCPRERLLREVGNARRPRVEVHDWDGAVAGATSGTVADAVILLDPFGLRTPQDVPALLAEAAATARTVVVVTRLLAESGEEDHDYEEDLTRMLVNGRSLPTARDMSRAVADAGLVGVADMPVGWGSHAVVVTRG